MKVGVVVLGAGGGKRGAKKWGFIQGEPAASVGWATGEADQTRDGIAGREVVQTDPWGWWKVRQRELV